MNTKTLGWVSEIILVFATILLLIAVYVGRSCTTVDDYCYPLWIYNVAIAYVGISLLPVSAIGFYLFLRRVKRKASPSTER